MHVAEAVSGTDGERFAAGDAFEAHDGTELRRRELGTSLLSLPARRRLRRVRLGLGDRSAPLLGLLLLRRVPVSLHADSQSRNARASAAAAAAGGGSSTTSRCRRTLLLAQARLVHLDALLRRIHEHRLRQTTGNGRRAVRLRVDRRCSSSRASRRACIYLKMLSSDAAGFDRLLVEYFSDVKCPLWFGRIAL